MKQSTCVLLFSLFLPHMAWSANEYVELCRLFKSGTLIRKPGTCDQYISCVNGNGELETCSPGTIFDANKQKCVDGKANNQYCGNRCENRNNIWVSDPTNCQYYFYCQEGTPLLGACERGRHFDESKQMCVYDVESECIDVGNICEILPDKTLFRNEHDCSKYYECKSGKQLSKSCSSTTYFSVEDAKCISRSLVTCNAHPNSGVCKSSTKIYKGFRPDGATCRGYFYCRDFGTVPDVDPIWGQCQEGTFFDLDNQSCGPPTNVVCKFNRCEGRGTMLVTSSTNDCHSYTKCENGVTVETLTCHNDMFFDERTQACTKTIIYDKCCDGQ